MKSFQRYKFYYTTGGLRAMVLFKWRTKYQGINYVGLVWLSPGCVFRLDWDSNGIYYYGIGRGLSLTHKTAAPKIPPTDKVFDAIFALLYKNNEHRVI